VYYSCFLAAAAWRTRSEQRKMPFNHEALSLITEKPEHSDKDGATHRLSVPSRRPLPPLSILIAWSGCIIRAGTGRGSWRRGRAGHASWLATGEPSPGGASFWFLWPRTGGVVKPEISVSQRHSLTNILLCLCLFLVVTIESIYDLSTSCLLCRAVAVLLFGLWFFAFRSVIGMTA